jgi:hypothetical protein
VASCPGTTFAGAPASGSPGPLYVSCQAGQQLTAWTADSIDDPVDVAWSDMGCVKQPIETVRVVGPCGGGDAQEIEIGFGVTDNEERANTINVCFDQTASKTLWSRHTLWDEVRAGDKGNDSPPFKPDNFFDYDVNHFYTMVTQRETIAELVGSQGTEIYKHVYVFTSLFKIKTKTAFRNKTFMLSILKSHV